MARRRLWTAVLVVALLACVGIVAQAAVAQAARPRFFVNIQPPRAVWAPGGLPMQPMVALRPQVNYVPTGTVLDAEATVSHDRRYVTINARPQTSLLLDLRDLNVDLIWNNGVFPPRPPVAPANNNPPAAPPMALGHKHAKMANEVGLMPNQRTALAKIVQAEVTAESQWDLAHGALLSELGFQQADAPSQAAKDAIEIQIRAIRAERDQIIAPFHVQMMTLLTTRQRAKANGFFLAEDLRDDLGFLKLSSAQTAKVREVCDKATQACVTTADVTRDPAIRAACLKQITSEVLDKAQQETYAKAAR
jgi:Spy/CpxP family protein refolding chaperone